ncbi:MAG: L-threonylcarbamoyladenylate synthase [Calditerrivibrio sp.]|nr:L-threonylcarbamoyladenylate synthase [Calditerrivibrio sp.]
MSETEIVKLTDSNFFPALDLTASVIKNDGIAVIPTETVYGIAASIYSSKGLKKIFLAKDRPKDNPLIVHIANVEQLKELTEEINEPSVKLINHFWPGPLTIIFKAKGDINRIITAGLNTIAVRMPNNLFTLKLIEKTGPLAAPSANISGRPSGTCVEDIKQELLGKVDIIIDEGLTEMGLESTVINPLTMPPSILRKGSISKEEIEKVIGDTTFFKETDKVLSPGTKYKHYAPKLPLCFIKKIDSHTNFNNLLSTLSKEKRLAIIHFDHDITYNQENILLFNLSNKPQKAMKLFFSTLRKVEVLVDEIVVLPLPEYKGLWSSLEDRIERGATRIIPVL